LVLKVVAVFESEAGRMGEDNVDEEEFDVVDCCDECLAKTGNVEYCSELCDVECRDLYDAVDTDPEFWGEYEEDEDEWW